MMKGLMLMVDEPAAPVPPMTSALASFAETRIFVIPVPAAPVPRFGALMRSVPPACRARLLTVIELAPLVAAAMVIMGAAML